jgi:hypothetical protein
VQHCLVGSEMCIRDSSCGGDGYGFSGSFNNLTGLLDGIKELLNQ